MKPNEYLKGVLADQTFADDAKELRDLRGRREAIAKNLRDHFADSAISTRWAGAMAKGTMIKESYDGDVTCYFNHDDTGAGETLEEIYENVEKCLAEDYNLERKASALRVREKTFSRTDLHVDVVPGRFIDEKKKDVNLHRTTGDKRSLKTNLDVHIEHIRDSGVVDAIRLMKYWNVRHGTGAKTFILELLVVKLLAKKKASGLSEQLKHVWTEFRDAAKDLSVEDPANPSGNDLKAALDQCRWSLQVAATTALRNIDSDNWEAIFGKLEGDSDEADKAAGFAAAVSAVGTPTKPWG